MTTARKQPNKNYLTKQEEREVGFTGEPPYINFINILILIILYIFYLSI